MLDVSDFLEDELDNLKAYIKAGIDCEHDADNLVQVTAIHFARYVKRNTCENYGAVLYTIAKRRMIDYYRKKNSGLKLVSFHQLSDTDNGDTAFDPKGEDGRDVVASLATEEILSRTLAAISQVIDESLTGRTQQVMECLLAGLSTRETAEELGITENNVRQRKHSGIRKVRVHLAAQPVDYLNTEPVNKETNK